MLWPLSLLTKFAANRRREKFISQPGLSWKPDIPVIVVGNVVVGGTGKTPMVIWLTKLLGEMNITKYGNSFVLEKGNNAMKINLERL